MILSTCKIAEVVGYLQRIVEKEYKMKEAKSYVGRTTKEGLKNQKEVLIYEQ